MTPQDLEKLKETLEGIADFSGEVQLLEWSKSTSRDGPKVKFMMFNDGDLGPFEMATVKKGKQAGQVYQLFAIRVDDLLDTATDSQGEAIDGQEAIHTLPKDTRIPRKLHA